MPIALAQKLISRWNSDPLRREILFFCIVGVIGFLIDLCTFKMAQVALDGSIPSFVLFHSYQIHPDDIMARCIALTTSTLVVWWLNRQHTFLSTDPDWLREFGRFALTRIFGIGLNAAVSLAILWNWPKAGATVAIAAGTGATMVINYMTSKHWAYKKADQ